MEKLFRLFLLWSWINISHELCNVTHNEPGSRLHFICTRVRSNDVNMYLKGYLKKRGEIYNECYEADRPVLSKPIKLTLNQIYFPTHMKSINKPKLKQNWLVPNIKVKGLTIQYTSLNSILSYSFKSSQFNELEFLEFKQVQIAYLHNKSLSGLENLKILHMYGMSLINVANNFLEPCQNLVEFRLSRCGPNPVKLDNFFGTAKYNHLRMVDIRYCELESINEKTFYGLKALKILRLNNDHIGEIKSQSFDAVLKTLTYLNLESNNLYTLPRDIFKSHGVRLNFTVNLRNNPWRCDLNELKSFMKNANVYGVICESPANMNGKNLDNCQSLCKPSTSIIEYPVETLEQSMEPQLEQVTIPLNNKFNLQCETMTNVTLNIPERTPLFRVKNTEFIVDSIHRSSDFDLLEFEATESNGDRNIKCLFIREDAEPQNAQVKRTFEPFQLYRFCAIKKKSNAIFPLDCSVFYSTIVECNSWILVDDKSIYIGCYIASIILAPFVGISISVAIAMYFRRKNRPLKINITDDMFSSQEELEAVKRLRQAETSDKWQSPANQMSMHDSACENFSKNEEDSTDADVTPPVPPRNNPETLDNS